MSRRIEEEALDLREAFRKAGIEISEDDSETLVRHARRYNKLQEDHCNYGLTPEQEQTEAKIEKRVEIIAARYGLKVEFTGDPRGYCTKLHAPDESVFNTWGGRETGYGIGENE